MENQVVICPHCGEEIMDCSWEEFIEFRNTKEAFIEDHIDKCVMNPHNEIGE